MFYQNHTLTTITLPSAEELGNYVFKYCDALESVYLPKVKTIGQQVFDGCTALKHLYVGGSESDYANLYPSPQLEYYSQLYGFEIHYNYTPEEGGEDGSDN